MTNITENVNDRRKNLINVAKGSIISFFITTILILIFSVILTYTNLAESTIPIGTIIISGLSILFGAILSSRHIKKNGIVNGGVVGLIYILVLYMISSMFGTGFGFNLQAAIMIIVSILAGAIGGILGVNFKK